MILVAAKKSKLPIPLFLWWVVVSFIFPPAFFAETIILLSKTLSKSETWLLPVWWVLICGVPVFFIGLLLTQLNQTLGKLALICYLVLSLFLLKLEYLEVFARLTDSFLISAASLTVGLGWLVIRKVDIVKIPPPFGMVSISIGLLVGVPLLTSSKFFGTDEAQPHVKKGVDECFAEYVNNYPDLREAYESGPRSETRSEWGKAHFISFGNAEGRAPPVGCRPSQDIANAYLDQSFSRYVDSHRDLRRAFDAVPRGETKWEWGEAHFLASGRAQNLQLPDRCQTVWEASQVSLKDRPNFYIVLLDSLIPGIVADVFFGEGSAAYAGFFEQNFHIPIGLTLQEKVPTKPSVRQIMWLDSLDAKSRGSASDPLPVAFSGRTNSPLKQLFRSNGYQITTGFTSEYWGKTGWYVDHWLTIDPTLGQSVLCMNNGSTSRGKIIGLGVCSILGECREWPALSLVTSSKSYSFCRRSENPKDFGDNILRHGERWSEKLLDYFATAFSDASPRFTAVYVYKPIGHTNEGFQIDSDLERYKTKFIDQSIMAEKLIRQILERLEKIDPFGVLIVAGDHGTYITRNIKGQERLKIIDQHGVAIGVWKSKNSCVTEVGEKGFTPNKSGYHTVPTVILSLIKCLTDSKEGFDRVLSSPEFLPKQIAPNWSLFLRETRNLPNAPQLRSP